MKVVVMGTGSAGIDREQKKKKKPPPPFSGVVLPPKCSNEDSGVEDSFFNVTRRVGGYSGVNALIEPAFAPNSMIPVAINKRDEVASTKKEHVERNGWNLQDVPALPEFHPLERTAVCVFSSSPAEVAERISKVLYERSIEATFDNSMAKAKCMTSDHVDFRIFLYRGHKTFSNGIIVEVQKRFGSSTNFHKDTMAILNAAEGKVSVKDDLMHDFRPPDIDLPIVSDSDDDSDPGKSLTSLEVVAMMFHQPCVDTHNLALQTLLSLTDPTKMGNPTARTVAKELLGLENEVGAKLMSLVIHDNSHDPFEMHIKAMEVLSNAFGVIRGDIPQELRNKLRPVLLSALCDAESNPRFAYSAAKCVKALLHGDHAPHEFYNPLQKALAAGQTKLAGLARKAHVCIKLLE